MSILSHLDESKPVIVVLGGNAFASSDEPLTMKGQFHFAREALAGLDTVLKKNLPLIVTHGNGPQVGHILTRVEESLGKAYAIPLEVCVAESEGELGYVLEQSLYNLLSDLKIQRPIASLLTQTVVDEDDPAFQNPSKPIGQFLSYEIATELRNLGFAVVEDSGRGFRRVVPSPFPIRIVEIEAIRQMLNLGIIVIAAGGGGIPVLEREHHLEGVEAVIDKDHVSCLLGENLDSELMIVLTSVPCAYENFGKPNRKEIGFTTTAEMSKLILQGHFAPGSMLPKIEAAVKFASRDRAISIICHRTNLQRALAGQSGTTITDIPKCELIDSE